MIFILRDHHSRPRLGLTRRAAPISCRPSFSDTGEARAVCEARALESASGFPPSRAGRLLTDKAAPISSSHAQAGVRRRRGRSPGREASQTAAIRLAVSQSVGRAVWRMHGRWRAAFAHNRTLDDGTRAAETLGCRCRESGPSDLFAPPVTNAMCLTFTQLSDLRDWPRVNGLLIILMSWHTRHPCLHPRASPPPSAAGGAAPPQTSR